MSLFGYKPKHKKALWVDAFGIKVIAALPGTLPEGVAGVMVASKAGGGVEVKHSGILRQRKPVRRRSKRLTSLMKIYVPRMLEFLRCNPFCFRCLQFGNKVKATEVHHYAGRRGAQLLVEKDWRASCTPCNLFAKDKPAEAIAEGWRAPVGQYHV